MDFTLFPGSVLALSAEAVDRLLRCDSGDGALLYLHLLRSGPQTLPPWPAPRLEGALAQLDRVGLAPPRTTTAPSTQAAPPAQAAAPEYSTETLTAALGETASPFTALADEVERQLGKKLNTPDLKALYTIYDHLALPAEVILLLITWCVEEQERKYGAGRRPLLSQIQKQAFTWSRLGIETAERAEEHLKKQALLRGREGQILTLLDLPPRPLVERERTYLSAWQEMGFGDEAIRLAYEKTVMKKGSMDWGYLTGILRRWHEKGLHTLAQIETGDREVSLRAGQGGVATPRPPADDRRAREDMERMRRLMQQMKHEED